MSRYIWKSVGRDTWTCKLFFLIANCSYTCTWSLEKCTICNGIHWKLCRNDQNHASFVKKTLFWSSGKAIIRYVSAWPWFLPICLAMAPTYVLAVLIRKPLHFFIGSSWIFSMHHCTAGLFKNKLTLDLSRYIWKSVGRDTWICKLFFLIANCPTLVPEVLEKCTICNGIHWKLCRNDQITHRLWKKLCLEFREGIIRYCFSLAMIFTYLPWQWLYICSSCLDSEPLHFFIGKQLNFFHASTVTAGLFKIKLTLDLSRLHLEKA